MAPSLPLDIPPASKARAQAALAWSDKQTFAIKAEFSGLFLGLGNKPGQTPSVTAFIAKIRKTDPAGASVLQAFFADPQARKVILDMGSIKTPTENLTGITNAVSDLNPVNGIASVISTLSSPNTWLRVGEGVLGIVLIAIGLLAITKSTPAGQALASTAVKAAKVIK